ncbi:class I SAM-dependent rRNA methyltransferase [Acidobacteriota bacterium]
MESISSKELPVVTLKPKGQDRLRSGHLWVFRNEVEKPPASLEPGDLVSVQGRSGRRLGIGYANPSSTIFVRFLINAVFERNRKVLGLYDNEIPDLSSLFRIRLEDALSMRERRLPDQDALRLVYGESDFLPGLIVDRYNGIVVVQIGAMGMERRRALLMDLLKDMLKPEALLERSETASRIREGLEKRTEWIVPPPPGLSDGKVWIVENGGRFLVDTLTGQKTGYYLDQRDNRRAVQSFARERRVLDCFCSTGAFSVQCALGGAAEVLGVDSSRTSVDIARINAEKNSVSDRCRFETADCISFLRSAAEKGGFYDLVILDPPSFARKRSAAQDASRGYREINLRAIKALPRYGLLATSSCSQIIERDRFLSIMYAAAKDARRLLRPLYEGCQPPDHPILLSMPETRYLKFFIFEVL